MGNDVLSAGHDQQGYFAKVDWNDEWYRPRRGRSFFAVAEYLASEAGVTILYVETFTQRDLERGEFRGPDPLSVFQSFCAAAGLELAIPVPGLWVVREPGGKGMPHVLVFARPLDPEKQGFLPVEQVGDVEKALVDQLPVRECTFWCGLGVWYYWLPEEGRDVLLVVSQKEGDPEYQPHSHEVFKVRLDRTGPKIKVECLWAAVVEGPMVPGIAEDLDGDGYRDFVFQGTLYDYGSNSVLSGKDGRGLLQFRGEELLVEKGVSGGKRVAVRAGWVDRAPDRYSKEVLPRFFAFSPEQSKFKAIEVKQPAPAASAAAQPPGEREHDALRRTFAAEVGGAERVRAYVVLFPPTMPSYPVEEIKLREHRRLEDEVTPEAIAKGLPVRILYLYPPVEPPSTNQPRPE
jgi:hypothetical protein